jgi:hypothetical protein
MRTTLTLQGMLAAHAKQALFTALQGVPDVLEAEVTLGTAVLRHDVPLDEAALRAAAALAGVQVVAIAVERRRLT